MSNREQYQCDMSDTMFPRQETAVMAQHRASIGPGVASRAKVPRQGDPGGKFDVAKCQWCPPLPITDLTTRRLNFLFS
jgi:hypothetical protein